MNIPEHEAVNPPINTNPVMNLRVDNLPVSANQAINSPTSAHPISAPGVTNVPANTNPITNRPATVLKLPTRSPYFESLPSNVQQRYDVKTLFINGIDPYCLSDDSPHRMDNAELLPVVHEIDIYGYFCQSDSTYTAEKFKAHKSLEAFRYLEAGFVENVRPYKICDYFVVVAKVTIHK